MKEAGTPRRYDYQRDPDAIIERSFEIVSDEVNLSRWSRDLHPLITRLVHACGMPDIVDDLVIRGDLVGASRRAEHIYVDAMMVEAGLTTIGKQRNLHCTIGDPTVPDLARQLETTRSAAAVELWRPYLDQAIVAIGNAPTALFHLLERMEVWRSQPLAILAFPVGFVGAAESKDALMNTGYDIPFVTLRGRRGGSALAAAAVNALLKPQ